MQKRMILRNFSGLLIVLVLAAMHLGTIRKKQDPVTMTQADAIPLKKKLEQEKDGKKEAPMPSFKLYGGKGFLSKTPVNETGEDDSAIPAAEATDEVVYEDQSGVDLDEAEDVAEDDLSAEEGDAEEEEDWWFEDENPPKNSFKESPQ